MLVGGLPTPLKNMKVSWGFLFPTSGVYNTMISHRISIGFLLLMGVISTNIHITEMGAPSSMADPSPVAPTGSLKLI